MEDLVIDHGNNYYENLLPFIEKEEREKLIQLIYTLLIIEDK